MTDPKRRRGPVILETDLPEVEESPATAAPILDAPAPAMVAATRMAGGRRSRRGWIGGVFWGALASLIGLLIANAVAGWMQALALRDPILGWIGLGLLGLVAAMALLVIARELLAFSRLSRVDDLRKAAVAAQSGSLTEARAVATRVGKLYAARPELREAGARAARRIEEGVDPDAVLAEAERAWLAPLDAAAVAEVGAAARTVAGVTALVPIALADVLAATTANVRMIRRIAEIYGGRAGLLGSWRLFRAVAAHLIATGAVAVGDDFLQTVAGGGALARVSRRFGEGVVNGALTARVGVAAMEVCRPMPFAAVARPSVRAIAKGALAGLFDRREKS